MGRNPVKGSLINCLIGSPIWGTDEKETEEKETGAKKPFCSESKVQKIRGNGVSKKRTKQKEKKKT